jgi:hypothetical protein
MVHLASRKTSCLTDKLKKQAGIDNSWLANLLSLLGNSIFIWLLTCSGPLVFIFVRVILWQIT